MVKDTIGLLDVAPFNREAIPKIIQRRLKDAKNKVYGSKNDPYLEKDLREILGDYVPRKFGEIPKYMGNYEILCPGTKMYANVLKMKSKIIKEDPNLSKSLV